TAHAPACSGGTERVIHHGASRTAPDAPAAPARRRIFFARPPLACAYGGRRPPGTPLDNGRSRLKSPLGNRVGDRDPARGPRPRCRWNALVLRRAPSGFFLGQGTGRTMTTPSRSRTRAAFAVCAVLATSALGIATAAAQALKLEKDELKLGFIKL